jgi:peptide-methionine (S)-S-oxide reductase
MDTQTSVSRGSQVRRVATILLIFVLGVSQAAWAEKTYFAGGCFWCMESDFEGLPGVADVVSGFTGGTAKNPTYNGDHTGHYEAVEITYDPSIVSYQDLLDHYWVNIDPFDATGQFCDKGQSYRAAIFVLTPEERRFAEQSKQKVQSMFPDQQVVTEILDVSTFYPIKGDESYHQDYYKTNSLRYRFYRFNCGRDANLKEIWGERATH